MGSKLTSTGVTFGSNTTEQTKPVTEVNGIQPNVSGEITIDIGMTSTERSNIDSRITSKESASQYLTWGSTQEMNTASSTSGSTNEVPANCVMVGLSLKNFLDDNQANYDYLNANIKIRYKLIS